MCAAWSRTHGATGSPMAGSADFRAASTCLASSPLRRSVPAGNDSPSSLSSSFSRRITRVDAAPTDSLSIRAGAKPSGGVPSTEQKRSHNSSRGAPGGGTVTTETGARAPQVRAMRTRFCCRQKVRPASGGSMDSSRCPGRHASMPVEILGERPGAAVLHGLLPHRGDRAVQVAGGDHDLDRVRRKGGGHALRHDRAHRPEVLHRDHRGALVARAPCRPSWPTAPRRSRGRRWPPSPARASSSRAPGCRARRAASACWRTAATG